MMISKWNMAGCAITSVIMTSAVWSNPQAVNVTDLGCGPENCGQDSRGDIVWHDPATGRVTLHYLTDNGVSLISSDFTLDGIEIPEGAGGQGYQPGTILFSLPDGSGDSDSGSGASARYEVYGTLSELEVSAAGCNFVGTSDEAAGLTSFALEAISPNTNGTTDLDASATAYVSPVPKSGITNGVDVKRVVTAFRVLSPGVGTPNDNFEMYLQFATDPAGVAPAGRILVQLDADGRIEAIVHDTDADLLLQASTQASPVIDDETLYYFNQDSGTPGWGSNLFRNSCDEATGMLTPQVKFEYQNGETVQFVVNPVIELYFGGQVIHVELDDAGDGFVTDPVFTEEGVVPPDGLDGGDVHTPNTNGTGLQVDFIRTGPIHEIADFDSGSGYTAVPTISIIDPGGEGTDADLELLFTEEFTGGPRQMQYVDEGGVILLPGAGWQVQSGNFSGDGDNDLFWWNPTFGTSMIWLLNNGHVEQTVNLPATDQFWTPVVADLSSNGRSEIFWAHDLMGTTAVWSIDPTIGGNWISSAAASSPVADTTWKLAGRTSRYGREALIWQNMVDGVVGTWTMAQGNPSLLTITNYLTYPNGEILVPGGQWRIAGSSDLNGDGFDGDLLWTEGSNVNRVAIWLMGGGNFLEGDYLSYNGEPVAIDAGLGGIGTYSSADHVNLIWNQGNNVVNWQMDRGNGTSDNDNGTAGDDSSNDNFLIGQSYRVAGAWNMTESGVITPGDFNYFQGLPEIPGFNGDLGDLIGGGGGLDLGDILDDLPIDDGGSDGNSGGGGGSSGGLDVPAGVDPCDYICSWDPADDSTWPPEFDNLVGDPTAAGIINLMIGVFLDEYGCDPCPDPLGACCTSAGCLETTQSGCPAIGTWLGADTTCSDCP
ncbi:MAG: VCBS repeat-containing protein [Phycisphaerales bacterium]|nr:VCBS repeat-containing protein [Phycisphaerales bacterium]